MKKAHYFQHVEFESPQNILNYLEEKEYDVTSTKFYEERFSFPNSNAIDVLVVMGGPMGVDDTDLYPWLEDELTFISNCIQSGKKVIGVCLGSQFIAKAMGADVFKNFGKEIGWREIELEYFDNEYAKHTVFHWHGDTFDLPAGCKRIATNDATANQGFVSSNVLALQFHIEMTKEGIATIVEQCGSEIEDGGDNVATKDEILNNHDHFENNRNLLYGMFDYFLKD